MVVTNPFAQLSAVVPPFLMQAYVLAMVVLVALGTVYDVIHKGSARYFFENWRSTSRKGTRQVSGGEKVSLALATAAEALVSGEFCNARRRIASSDDVWVRGVRGCNGGARVLLS